MDLIVHLNLNFTILFLNFFKVGTCNIDKFAV
jgi:hypothetical protein